MSWWDRAVIAIVSLVVCAPALFTHNGFGVDYTNHLWLVGVQTRALSSHGLPTYFLNAAPVGVFYPFYMFYGGTLYVVAGAIGVVLGDSGTAGFLAVCLLAVAGAYGGLLWLARQLGVRGWAAHAPAITFVASAYYITNFYGRGAWPELVATSTVPLVAASALAVARAEKVRGTAPTLFVISTVFFVGSHNITLVLGVAFFAMLLVVLQIALGRRLWFFGWRRLLVMVGLIILAVCIDAWFLLPDFHNASATSAGATSAFPWQQYGFLDTPGLIFNPFRSVPKASSTTGLFVQEPDWLIAWACLAIAAVWRGTDRTLRRVGAALIVLLVLTLCEVLIPGVWNHLPRVIRDAQFPYRENTYVVLAVSGLVLIASLMSQQAQPDDVGSRRRGVRAAIAGGLIAATLITVALAVWQMWVPNDRFLTSYRNRDRIPHSSHVMPKTFYGLYDYSDATDPVVAAPSTVVSIPPRKINGNSVTVRIDPPARAPFTMGLAAGPYAVSVRGDIFRVGRVLTTGQQVYQRVHPGTRPLTITISPVAGAVRDGLYLTLLALAVTLALGLRELVMLARRVRR